eukprot:CAMPEP_0182912870 /NCGR_PEP_ID=MMETSP0034_2-20130328/37742_1 /TAXON_ID=156128 /ORGANISM="Nephroselmis pyriformis, Strain CCMP717" /LENGTH=314 /DNA_ID=CAMNT_0025049563 /DNA_START=136 /DNA_END=1080 /DNA_ORIENTATION=-
MSGIHEVYDIKETLGTGGFSVVKLGIHKQTGKGFAVKIMKIPDGPKAEKERGHILKEIALLQTMDHKSVIKLYEVYDEGQKVYLVTELLTGGELLDALLECGQYSEHDAKVVFRQLIEGLQYLHSFDIVHRDLKLENLLLSKKGDMTTVKIADFGLAKRATEGQQFSTVCGSPLYVAPEVIQSKRKEAYSNAVDYWSAGVVLYILLAGYPPFDDDNEQLLFQKIRNGQYDFDDEGWKNVSENAKDLIRGLLEVDHNKRLTAAKILSHPWMSEQLTNKRLNLHSQLRASSSKLLGSSKPPSAAMAGIQITTAERN